MKGIVLHLDDMERNYNINGKKKIKEKGDGVGWSLENVLLLRNHGTSRQKCNKSRWNMKLELRREIRKQETVKKVCSHLPRDYSWTEGTEEINGQHVQCQEYVKMSDLYR